ncbi:MAG: UxaA family hydrolase [Lawsonibacter sp.]
MDQVAFVIDVRDNVATALAPLSPGAVSLTGDAPIPVLEVVQDIPDGHKVALRPIRTGEPIVKYGVVIGAATQEIAPGTWVHLHCMRSLVDQRSSHLDIHTGAPCDIEYE